MRNMDMKLGQDEGYIRLPLNEHANHECRCVIELKSADVAGGIPRGEWGDGLTACEPARRGRQLRSFVRLEIPAPQYLAKARGT